MNLQFKELKCPKCGGQLEQGSITASDDVSMVKRCAKENDPNCNFWMIIVIPNNEYSYAINKKLKEPAK